MILWLHRPLSTWSAYPGLPRILEDNKVRQLKLSIPKPRYFWDVPKHFIPFLSFTEIAKYVSSIKEKHQSKLTNQAWRKKFWLPLLPWWALFPGASCCYYDVNEAAPEVGDRLFLAGNVRDAYHHSHPLQWCGGKVVIWVIPNLYLAADRYKQLVRGLQVWPGRPTTTPWAICCSTVPAGHAHTSSLRTLA